MIIQNCANFMQNNTFLYTLIQGVLCFDYCHSLEVLVTGSIDHLVRLWNPYVTSKPMAILKAHSTAVLDVCVASRCGLVFSYSHDGVSHSYLVSYLDTVFIGCFSCPKYKYIYFYLFHSHTLSHTVALCLGFI